MSFTTSSVRQSKRLWPSLPRVLIYLICTILVVVFLFPIAWSILTSFKPPIDASASPSTGLPSRIVFDNYIKLNDYGAGIGQYVYNSVSAAIMTVIGAVVLSTLGGFGF